MGNPFKPGNVYYADVPETGVFPKECRNNPDKGPRPWIILYCRQHARTGVVLAAPLYTKGEPDLASHVACIPDHFDLPPGDGPGVFSTGFIHLEQLRALDKTRLKLGRGPLASMKQ